MGKHDKRMRHYCFPMSLSCLKSEAILETHTFQRYYYDGQIVPDLIPILFPNLVVSCQFHEPPQYSVYCSLPSFLPSPVLLILNLELLSNSMRGSRACGIGAGFMILECDSKSSYSPEELMLHSKQEKKRLPSISASKQKPIGSARHAASW